MSQKIIELLNIKEKVLNIYTLGSRVYGTATETSDYDFIIVIENIENEKDGLEPIYHFRNLDNMDATIYTLNTFKKLLDLFDHHVVECVSLGYSDEYSKFIILETEKIKMPEKYDPLDVRKAIHERTNHSFVKFKKKMTVEKDEEHIGKKSLWHSIRIGLFGIQILKYGYIKDYSCANIYFKDIVLNKLPEKCIEKQDYTNEEIVKLYEEKYKSIRKEIESEIKKLAPKDLPKKKK